MLNIPMPPEKVITRGHVAETSWYNYWLEVGNELRKLIAATAAGIVNSFNGRTGVVVPQAGDYNAGQITGFDEAAQDAVGGALVDSATITFTYNDAANTITAVVAPGSLSSSFISDFTEAAQDAVGGAFIDSARVDFTYTDATNQITADLVASSVANGFLATMAAGTVKMRRSAAGTGNPTDETLANLKTDMAFTKADVGLGNVDNTSDANKPVSTAQAAAIALKSDLASPTFTGDPKAPTPIAGDNDTSIATTAFVTAADTAATATRQPLDATLTALAAYNTVGFLVETAADTFAGRTLQAGTSIGITNPAGTAGDPTISVNTAASNFTPGLTLGGGSTGMTFTSRQGRRWRVGDLEFFAVTLSLSAKGTSTGALLITGLPTTEAQGITTAVSCRLNNAAAGITAPVMAVVLASSTTIRLDKMATGTATQLTDADIGNSTIIQIAGFYAAA